MGISHEVDHFVREVDGAPTPGSVSIIHCYVLIILYLLHSAVLLREGTLLTVQMLNILQFSFISNVSISSLIEDTWSKHLLI